VKQIPLHIPGEFLFVGLSQRETHRSALHATPDPYLHDDLPRFSNRIWTMNSVGWEGVPHIKNRDFSDVINAALADKGFAKTKPEKFVDVGFGHHTVLSLAGASCSLLIQACKLAYPSIVVLLLQDAKRLED
jgi:hypothetical protein